MAGLSKNLAKCWEDVAKHITFDEIVPLNNQVYLDCTQRVVPADVQK